MAAATATSFPAWSVAEHEAFVAGLAEHGTEWSRVSAPRQRALARARARAPLRAELRSCGRAVVRHVATHQTSPRPAPPLVLPPAQLQTLVPTRTLAQIRVHAQRFLARQAPAADEAGAGAGAAASSGAAASGGAVARVAGFELRSGAHLRHVLVEPLMPADALGFELASFGGAGGAPAAVAVASFHLIGHGALSAAEESDLVRIGDRVVGVSGVATAGLSAAQVTRAIAAARAVSLHGAYALHLADARADAAVAAAREEVAVQCAGAAFQLLGSKHAVETAQAAIAAALAEPGMPLQ
jgi:hypothetical protein